MPTNDRFIQSIVELLDKLIDYQSRNATLLAEFKSSLGELRNDANETLINLREKLPVILSRDQEENYRKLSLIVAKIEDNNSRIADNIKIFEENYNRSEQLHKENSEILGDHTDILTEIKANLAVNKDQQEELEKTVKEVNQFLGGLKSKKAWIALLIAGIAALATMISAVAGGIEAIKKMTTTPTIQTSPQGPTKP